MSLPPPTSPASPASPPPESEAAVRARALMGENYRYGFTTPVESIRDARGVNEASVRIMSKRKDEPEWLLRWRLDALAKWQKMREPHWALIKYPPINYEDLWCYAAPRSMENRPKTLADVDPELLRAYDKLGVPLSERASLAGVTGVAVDAVFDSVSVATTFRKELAKAGVIFCSISDAVHDYPELVRPALGSVVPSGDNFFAALNAAVFSDGSFVYIPKGVRCPMELSTYFRINEAETGQFERTLIVADEGAEVSYLEGCTAPMRDNRQLHAAVVELVAMEGARIRYSTVQNWYPGDAQGRGGIYNFVTKRGDCRGAGSSISWTQMEAGSVATWKYPSCVLRGEGSVGEFFSVAVSNGRQMVDSGTKMIHLGEGTRSRIVSKGVSAGHSSNAYRGLVSIAAKARGARNATECDSLLIGGACSAHALPLIESSAPDAIIEHEASVSRLSEEAMDYCRQRGLDAEAAMTLIVQGFCREALHQLPMEFAAEAQGLLSLSLEGAIG